jgi:hypothetical protein
LRDGLLNLRHWRRPLYGDIAKTVPSVPLAYLPLVVPYKRPLNATSPACGYAPPVPPLKLCNTRSVPDLVTSNTVPKP